MITMESDSISLSVHDPESALLQGMTAWDDRDGDVTGSMIVESVYGVTPEGFVTVTYAAFDRAGNVTKIQRTVKFTDYQSPRFTLSQALVFEYGTPFDVLDIVGAEDVLEGDILRRVKATMLSSGVSVTEEGTHDVQFRVTNSLGDNVQLVLPVEVYPPDRYDAQLTLREYILYVPVDGELDINDYLLEFTAQGVTLDLRQEWPEDIRIRIGGSVDFHTPGVYPISYTVIREMDGHSYMAYSKLLVVVEE